MGNVGGSDVKRCVRETTGIFFCGEEALPKCAVMVAGRACLGKDVGEMVRRYKKVWVTVFGLYIL